MVDGFKALIAHKKYVYPLKQTLIRNILFYVCIASAGILLSTYSTSVPIRITGLGLIFPGAGFLAHASFHNFEGLVHIGLSIAGLILFVISLIIWFATGNIIAPTLTWFLLIISAASMTHSHHISAYAIVSALSIVAIFFLFIFAITFIQYYRSKIFRLKVNKWLVLESPEIQKTFEISSTNESPELSLTELYRLRFTLDRALQPLPDFKGFEWLDQFQTAAVRYQINFLGYGLSMAHYHYMPACQSYINQAQIMLIHKLAEYRIWRYWVLEHLWGNLRYNPDPVSNENIMYSGFAATQMAMYEAASGSNNFQHQQSFRLVHSSGKCWEHSLPSLVNHLGREMERSPYHLIACEPNWIYPLCNMIAAAAIKFQSPELWEKQQDRFRQSLEQHFIDGRGRIIACRSRRIGAGFPMIGGIMPQALPCLFLNAILPDIALRQWLLVRRQIMEAGQNWRSLFWRIDTGNYRFSRAAAYASTALAAAEMGDYEIYQQCIDSLEEECPPIVRDKHIYRPHASVWAHGVECFARSHQKNAFQQMIARSRQPHNDGPYISDIAYPDILIASAHVKAGKLTAVFYPGTEEGIKSCGISGLQPQQDYQVTGAITQIITADRLGNISLSIPVAGRTELSVYKAA